MTEPRKQLPKVRSTPKPPKPAVRLDDLIPNEKVLGGRRVIFGVRAPPVGKPKP